MFHGSIPALVTPFAPDGAVDEAALTKFVDWQIEQGSTALVPCGTTGEASTLSFDEHYRVIELVVQAAAGRVPVIAGCGSNDTATALRHMAKSAELGADAALVVCPYYNKPSQAGLLAHFSALAQASDLPIVLYNVPGRTVADLAVATTAELAKLPTIVGIKDASGDLARVTALRGTCPAGFVQLSGNDDLTLGYMAMGGNGCISVTANVAPRLCADFQAACARGDYAAARELNDRLYPLHAAMFADASPGPAKYALAKLGVLGDTLRLPMTPPSDVAHAAIDAALAHAGLA
ncbi:4-hydroxy-tetrahydrodipicolinate synthase [Glacieibacterium frigidum]|uniref:4-hydroxy-tetrahydrodipicolinate synthase n=1 Tax=Glacieibacterium frigidum TaxID=2593303 RepID=A0A552UI06_9SPHN|nr:4-hydroxy-tetrahydrodipicolinate synthase [Glacieibacterium frigidum]TRW17821.1 4-hydroxy-tetrahydrodipicolinate synthase [Glacieibacterium frigidum]